MVAYWLVRNGNGTTSLPRKKTETVSDPPVVFSALPWFQSSQKLYAQLVAVAQEFSATPDEVVTQGVALFQERERALRDTKKGPTVPHVGRVSDSAAREIYRFLSAYFYQQRKLSKSRVRELAKQASEAARSKRQLPTG